MYGYIYKTTNLQNGMIYIGQKKSVKFLGHSYLGSGKLLRKAIKKYGRNNFVVELLEEVNESKSLDEREIYWIGHYHSTDHSIGYNISEGGYVNRTMVGENNPFYGKMHREDSLKKLSDSLRGKVPWNKGLKKDSDDRVRKYAASITGKPSSSKGTVWIYSGTMSKMIAKADLPLYIKEGWLIGRPDGVSDPVKRSQIIKGRKRINNGVVEKNVWPEEVQSYLEQGWQLGRKRFKHHKNRG